MKTKRIMACLGMLLTLLLGAYAFADDAFEQSIQRGDYATARARYEENMQGNIFAEMDAIAYLREYLQSAVDSFARDEISAAQAEAMCALVTRIDILPTQGDGYGVAQALADISHRKASGQFYEKGLAYQAEGNYKSAILSFQAVVQDDPNYADAQLRIQMLGMQQPAKLTDMHIMENRGLYISIYSDRTDSYGRVHEGEALYFHYGSCYNWNTMENESGRLQFALNREYTRFQTALVVPAERKPPHFKTEAERPVVWIYGDGILLYQSPVMEYASKPEAIDIDVTAVDALRIEYRGGASTWHREIMFVNPLLYR